MRVVQQLGYCADFDSLVDQYRDSIADGHERVEIVGDQEDRQS